MFHIKSQQQKKKQLIAEKSNLKKITQENYLDSQILALLNHQKDNSMLHKNEQQNNYEALINVNDSNKKDCQNDIKSNQLLESQKVLMEYLNAIKQQNFSINVTQQSNTLPQISPSTNANESIELIDLSNKLKLKNLNENSLNIFNKQTNENIDEINQNGLVQYQQQEQVTQLNDKNESPDALTLKNNVTTIKRRVPYSHESFHTIKNFLMEFNLVNFFLYIYLYIKFLIFKKQNYFIFCIKLKLFLC